MTRSFDQWPDGDAKEDYSTFLRHFGEFVAALTPVTELYSRLHEEELPQQAEELCRYTEDAREAHRALADFAKESSLPLADPSEPYGLLIGEATRLMDEIQYTCDVLQNAVEGTPDCS